MTSPDIRRSARSPQRSTRWTRPVLFIVAMAAVFGGWSSGVVDAHAELRAATPGNGDVLESSPEEILLEFSEHVDPIDPGIRLLDATGREIPVTVDQDKGAATIRAVVDDVLDDGSYVVAWQVVSADSHRVRGAYTFSVGESTAVPPGFVEGIFDDTTDGRNAAVVLGIGRALSYAGIGLFVGLLTMATFLAPNLVAAGRARGVLIAAVVAATVGTSVMIAAQAHLIGGSLWSWDDVIGTTSGRWWYLRLLALVALAVLMIVWTRLGRARPVIVPAAGAAILAVVAAGGHGIAGDSVAAGYLATVLHLAAMSLWIGGLVLVVLAPAGGRLAMAGRVSPWALGTVVVLAITGSVNAWRQLGGLTHITGSAYGRWLLVKLVLVAGVLAVAAFSRRSLRRSAPAPSIRRSVTFELVGIALVLAATAGLVNSSPPDDAPGLGSGSAVVGQRIAQIELDPAVTGGTEMHVYITSPSGGLDRADEITVDAELEAGGIGPLELETRPAGPNHVIGTNVDLPIPGDWTFVVTARYGEFEQVTFTMQIPVES